MIDLTRDEVLEFIHKLRRDKLLELDLTGVDLRDADLRSVDLRSVDLRGANLLRWTLVRSNLSRADLRGANLTLVKNLDEADLKGAQYDSQTRWPRLSGADASGATRAAMFDPMAAGAVLVEDDD